WVEEATGMNEEQLAEFYAAVRPVRLRSLASTVNKSTTILLPAWKQHLADLNLPERMLRQDVRTRWQSTNDMVVNAVGMKRAIRSFCADGDLGVDLDKFRMNAREWQIAEQLVDVLKYYALTDSSEAYRIAMVLHPRYKMEYFKSEHWPDDWIETAKTVVRDRYDAVYKH
ncbi:uncharacterized protein BXZ73DRAFT_24955, partial [Epithele typhae]|uniref:uncharacterized protein n=1 Tax=Epithele typhae TaxID=378194 RepID=UPI00200734CF